MATSTPGTCGACIAFVADAPADEAGERGHCKLRPELKEISHLLPRCRRYVERGTGATWKPPPVARPRGSARADREDDEEVTIEEAPPPKLYGSTIDLGEDTMDTTALRALLRDVLAEEGIIGETVIGKRWQGGTLILKPADASQQPKEIPLEAFFHKIVMVRDRLRVLEQKINASDKMSDQDKVEMQQYVSRIYGSLTTFNILFRDKDDHFVGQKGE